MIWHRSKVMTGRGYIDGFKRHLLEHLCMPHTRSTLACTRSQVERTWNYETSTAYTAQHMICINIKFGKLNPSFRSINTNAMLCISLSFCSAFPWCVILAVDSSLHDLIIDRRLVTLPSSRGWHHHHRRQQVPECLHWPDHRCFTSHCSPNRPRRR